MGDEVSFSKYTVIHGKAYYDAAAAASRYQKSLILKWHTLKGSLAAHFDNWHYQCDQKKITQCL